MAGQGFHLGTAELTAQELGWEFSTEMIIGVLALDACNAPAGGRRCSHFTGGAGCILPRFGELRQVTTLQHWDTNEEASFLVDPAIRMEVFEATNRHIPEGPFKNGIRLHLLADLCYDRFVQEGIFDFTEQSDNRVIVRATEEILDGATFRREIYASYPMLDQLMLEMAGINAEDMESYKDLVTSTFNDSMGQFLLKYMNFDSTRSWVDSVYFKLVDIDMLVNSIISYAVEYFRNL